MFSRAQGWAASSPDAILIASPSGRVAYWNAAAETLFGYRADEAMGCTLLDLIVPSSERERYDRDLADSLRGGLLSYGGLRRRKDGSLVFVDVSAQLLEEADEPLILFSKRDVSRRVVRADTRLMESRFRDLLESMPDAAVIVNETGAIVIANRAAELLFGYGHGELPGVAVEALLPERFRATHFRHREHFAAAPRKRTMDTGVELLGCHKDGSEFPIEVSPSPLFAEERSFVMSAIRDVTGRRKIEQDLQEKNLALARAIKAKDAFFAGMNHELRTPLNAIIGFTGTLLMQLPGPLNADQVKQLTTIKTSAKHLLSLINDLLQIARLDADKPDLRLESVDVRSASRDAIETLAHEAARKGIQLVGPNDPQPEVARADSRAVAQILINLLGNAIKFGAHGRVEVSVASAGVAGGSRVVRVSVRDEGPGIDEATRAHLFTAFGRGAGAGAFESTGLGLFLSRRLATAMGGTLDCEPATGSGTTFTLTLPAPADWQSRGVAHETMHEPFNLAH